MKATQLDLPLQPQSAEQVAAAIKAYIITQVRDAWRQPSARELVVELDRNIGIVARWDLVSVVQALSKDRELTHAVRDYLESLLEGDALIKALRGEYAPDQEVFLDDRRPASPERPLPIIGSIPGNGGLHVPIPGLRAVQPHARAGPEPKLQLLRDSQ